MGAAGRRLNKSKIYPAKKRELALLSAICEKSLRETVDCCGAEGFVALMGHARARANENRRVPAPRAQQ